MTAGWRRRHMLFFWRHWAANNAALAAAESRLAATHAHAAGDGALRARALGWHIATLMYGPRGRGRRSQARSTRSRARSRGPTWTACVELGRAEVERLRGAFDRAADADRPRVRGLPRARDAADGRRLSAAACADRALPR